MRISKIIRMINHTPSLSVVCLVLLLGATVNPASAQDLQVFMGANDTVYQGYPVLNLDVESLYKPQFEKLLSSYDKSKFDPENEAARAGMMFVDKQHSTDHTGSVLMNMENPQGGVIHFGSLKVPPVTSPVLWLKILARGDGLALPVGIRVKANNPDPVPDAANNQGGALFAGPTSIHPENSFEWSYYFYQMYNRSCFKKDPLNKIDVYFDFQGLGKIWIDKMELVDPGVSDDAFWGTMPGCGEDGH